MWEKHKSHWERLERAAISKALNHGVEWFTCADGILCGDCLAEGRDVWHPQNGFLSPSFSILKATLAQSFRWPVDSPNSANGAVSHQIGSHRSLSFSSVHTHQHQHLWVPLRAVLCMCLHSWGFRCLRSGIQTTHFVGDSELCCRNNVPLVRRFVECTRVKNAWKKACLTVFQNNVLRLFSVTL